MKSLNWKLCSLALAAITSFSACSSDDDDNGNAVDNGGNIENGATLKGSINSDVTLKAGNTYKLSGEYIVEDGATLNIEAGVKIISIYDEITDYILVKQGGKINAVGTAEKPIIMTAEKEEPGAWGGIHICGKAHTNAEGGKGSSEIGGAPYGGNDDADNSGTLKYIRLEYTGFVLDEQHEANGISFYGVGNGTTVDHCEAYKGSDDGFEFFGGSVNVSNMVVVNCSDDSFDWTEGWNGKGTNLVAFQESAETLGYECDCLIEADNNENNYSATPVSHPTLTNLILAGNGSSKQGIRLRRGTQVEISNAQVWGKGQALVVESEETENALASGTSKLSNVSINGTVNSEKGIYTNDNFIAAGNKNNQDAVSFDEIVSQNSWMSGWVETPDNGKGNESENILGNGSTLKGNITEDVTLKAGYSYKLSGEYIVEDGATLNIEEGVTITAIYDEITDYILVKQGGKINAVGTAEKPIIMTAEKEEPGAWGGIHICGKAHTNAEGGVGSSEIGGAAYGGSDDADNSGTLQYIRLEYTGFALNEEHEANGISFYGVGNGTTVDHCEAYKGSDDGFEFFGGSVNVSNMVVVSCSDDSFDWTEGWNGTGTNLVAYQEAEATLGYDCDCLMEADNNENNYVATPVSHPVLKNLILAGNGGSKQGIRLRRGTQVEIDNAKVCGKGKALAVESKETEDALVAGTSKLANITLANALDSKEGIYTNDAFIAAGNKVDASLAYANFDAIKAACDWMNGSWVK